MRVATVYRVANETIAARARELGLDGPIPFICECESACCLELVHLTIEAYDDATRSGPLLHPQHQQAVMSAA
jgi:hypothetical protein